MVPCLNTETLVSGVSIFYLLVVDGTVLDRCLHEGVAKAGTIDCAGSRHKGGIPAVGDVGDLRHFCLQNFASNLHQPLADRQGWRGSEFMRSGLVGVNANVAGSRPHALNFPDVLING